MSSQPWYPWYPGDAAAKTAHLSLEEFGAYRRLLDHYYSTSRALPNDPARLARIAGAEGKQGGAAVRRVLEEFFPVQPDGLLHNRRADQEITKMEDFARQQSEKGKKSAAARWGNRGYAPAITDAQPDDNRSITGGLTEQVTEGITEPQPNCNLLQPQLRSTSTTPNSKPREIERRDRSGKGGKKHAMPATFAVSDRVRLWAEGKGWGSLDAHLESFRLKCQANGYTYADWDSALMEAIRKDWAGLRANGRNGSSETLAELMSREPGGLG